MSQIPHWLIVLLGRVVLCVGVAGAVVLVLSDLNSGRPVPRAMAMVDSGGTVVPAQTFAGRPSPTATLRRFDGTTVQSRELIRQRPMVLAFGSYTCQYFTDRLDELEKLSKQYQDEVDFFVVYVREAHPTDVFKQPGSHAEIVANAKRMLETMALTMPVLVDDVAGTASEAFGVGANRLCLIDAKGEMIYYGGANGVYGQLGPYGFDPTELDAAIVEHLAVEVAEDQAEPASE